MILSYCFVVDLSTYCPEGKHVEIQAVQGREGKRRLNDPDPCGDRTGLPLNTTLMSKWARSNLPRKELLFGKSNKTFGF